MAETSVENLKSFTLRCKNLKALPEWIVSLENLKFLKFEACESITELPLCIRNLSRLEELSLNEKTLDISNLKSLKKLRLGGCRLLEDVQGIENAAQNIEELVLPGPYGSTGCCSLSDDFKKQVFKELAFERLRRFDIFGILSPESTSGHQQLSFMFPNGANGLKPELMIKRLVLNKVQPPIHIKLLEDDHRVVFESTLEVQRPIVKNFFRPIWIPLPRVSNCQIRYRGGIVFDGLGFICVPCHGRCAMLSRNAIGGSEVVEVEEVAGEDDHEDGGGRDNETEAVEEADREPKVFINVQQEVVEDGRENSGGRDGTETEADKVEVQRECEVAEDDREEGRDHEKETEAEEIERETEVLNEVEEVAEDGRENGGGRDGMIEDEHHEGGNEIRAYGPKIIQVFQPLSQKTTVYEPGFRLPRPTLPG
ncbi:hypothetical protein EJ110_NYTH11597 [Nymphaea thermarum]|nr:hypothetical protein EJ110_NYTH11597 [Nymphaea thermarum]